MEFVCYLFAAQAQVVCDVKEEQAFAKKSEAVRKWPGHSAATRTLYGIPLQWEPWTSRPDIRLRGISGTNARGRDLVNVAWAWRLKQFPDASLEDLTRDFYVDLSQSVHFGPWSEGFVRTLCKSTRIYSFQWDMVLTRRHQLACMGMPLKCLQILGDHKSAFAFAGNAFACPVIATALIAFCLNAEGAWWH